VIVTFQNSPFKLHQQFEPAGDQPEAIAKLIEGIEDGLAYQTLLGVTGSGKTFTMANVIAAAQKPTLVLAHNKTLAAQLYSEFCDFFPKNRVEYFVSYYDYYQPESYIPSKDQYIEKDSAINPKIEMLRLSTTASLSFRRDVIVVASVSCIYGLGNPENFRNMGFELSVGQKISRAEIMSRLIDILFERNDIELMPGRFRVKGDTIDIIPGYFNNIIRIEMFGDEIERISEVDKNTGTKKEQLKYFYVYPARHQLDVIAFEQDIEQPAHDLSPRYFLADKELESHVPEVLGVAKTVDAGDRGDHDHVAPVRERGGGGEPEHLDLGVDGRVLLDVLVLGGDVGLGLVVVVVRDKILDAVFREEIAELPVELGCERLVVHKHERGLLRVLYDVRHRERLA
jgi:excinuclease UvrABC helicase subunit UvrB